MSKPDTPSYGVLEHYLGQRGRVYFAWQGAQGAAAAVYNKHLWAPHIAVGDHVLDFGCGGGSLLQALGAARSVGVEVNPRAQEQARLVGIEVCVTIDEVRGTFDKVISSHTLEHVPHPREAVLRLKDKLRDEHSRMLLLLPLDDWRSRSNRHFRRHDANMHLQAWTPQLLGNLLASCDLAVESVRVVTHAWPPGRALFWRLSPFVFHAAAAAWAVLNRQRQLFAIARLPVASESRGR